MGWWLAGGALLAGLPFVVELSPLLWKIVGSCGSRLSPAGSAMSQYCAVIGTIPCRDDMDMAKMTEVTRTNSQCRLSLNSLSAYF